MGSCVSFGFMTEAHKASVLLIHRQILLTMDCVPRPVRGPGGSKTEVTFSLPSETLEPWVCALCSPPHPLLAFLVQTES